MPQTQSATRNTNNIITNFLFLSIILTIVPIIQTQSDTYTNPAISNNCPDPGVISFLNENKSIEYVAVVTSNDNTDAFPMYTSTDLINWSFVNYVFPQGSPNFPKWAVSDFWAPEIHRINETQWNLYFAARNAEGNLCVGVAYSNSPLGPFYPTTQPLIALNNIPMGAIDPTYFIWGNNRYVIWKEDGNAVGKPTPININQLSYDGLSVSNTTATQLITNDQPWEGAVTEAPWMIRQNGFFYLFYSGNAYNTPYYAVGVARSTNLFGPFEKYPNPILHTANATSEWQGPGHCSVLCPATQQSPISELTQCYMIYHSWQGQNIGGDYPRMMLVDHIQWMNDDGVVVDQIDCSVASPCWPFIANFYPSQSPVSYPY